MVRLRRTRAARLAPVSEVSSDPREVVQFGRRAVALANAIRSGVAVIPSWVVPADAFRDAVRNALPPGHDTASLLRVVQRPVGIERAAQARERLLQLPLREELAADLASFWLDAGAAAPWGLLVSASPVCDDDTIAASAGLDVVVRGVKSQRGLEEAVRFVWSTAVHEDTLRTLRAYRIRDFAMAVLVQALDATVAHGVLLCPGSSRPAPRSFAPPVDSALLAASSTVRVTAVTSCALGLAAPVVDGASARDLASLTPDCRVVEHRVAVKEQALVVDSQGAEFRATRSDEANRFSLSPTAVSGLCSLADAINTNADTPLLAQYVADRFGKVCLTEVRQTSGRGYPPSGDEGTVWSRVGLASELPGVTTPLTASLLEDVAPRTLRRALAALGCTLARGGPILRRVKGRPYWNLSLLLPALVRAPGLDPAALVGLVGDGRFESLRRQVSERRTALFAQQTPVVSARLLALHSRLESQLRRVERELDPYRRWFAEMDLAILPDESLSSTLADLRRRLEQLAELTLTVTLASLACQSAVRQILARRASTVAARAVQTLTSGAGELASAEPAAALVHIIAIAQRDSQARAALLARPVAAPSQLPHGATRRALSQFLEAYGDRGVGEAELLSPRWFEDPRVVVAMVTAGLHHDALDPDAAQSYVRVQAEAALADWEARLPLVDSALVRVLVQRARRLVALRERTRTSLARTLSMCRVAALDVGRRLRRRDPQFFRGSVFFATLDELVGALTSQQRQLRPITRLRQASFERDAGHIDPPEAFCGLEPTVVLPVTTEHSYKGVSCCGGIVTGSARVLGPRGLGADRLRPGEILVARSADVGLSPLLWMAAGVVCELGGPLASGSVVAREHGIPMVSGIVGATVTIRDGEPLRLDGDRGLLQRLSW